MQKDIGSEASYEKYKDSTVQLKPSLNGRTSASKQDIKSATPAVRDKISAVDLMPSLDLNHSPEPPGIIKTEIPLLSKKFQVRNRYPSDIRIFRYNQNGISSPNTSPGSAETSGAGSPFSSPTSLIGLSGTRKTPVQSRDTMGSPRTSIESTDSLSMELFESRVVRPFGRKFSSRGLFTAAQDQKKGKADSTKYIKTKDEVLVKKLDMVDPPIENKISDSKISPSQSAAKFTHDINQVNNLRVDDAVAEKEMLDSMQTDSNSQISPSTSPFSRSFVKLTDDGKRAKNFHVNDAATENDLLAPMQTDGHSQISPSTSPASESTVVDEASNEESKSEILGLVQTDGHSQDLPSTSPVTHYAVKLTDDKDQTTKMCVNDATTENEVLEPKQIGDHIQISPSTSSLSRSDAISTHDSDHTDVFNVVDVNSKKEMLKSVQTNDHSQNSSSTLTFTRDKDEVNFLHADDATTVDGMYGRSQISPSTSPISTLNMKLTTDMDQSKNLHVDDVETEDKVSESMDTDGNIQISLHTSPLSRLNGKITHDNDQTKIFYIASKNEKFNPVQTDDHSQNYPSTSNLSPYVVTPTRDYENMVVDAAIVKNKVLEPMLSDDHTQIPLSTSPLLRSSEKLTSDSGQIKISLIGKVASKNEMLELDRTDGHCPSTSPLSKSETYSKRESNEKLARG
ncbi:uncharacterized protein LOC141705272 [Apium graveolens]|uniref:uncharacterized protein LOC141705272 n=1 Tax=Apium graveolens TaxID=4045 RepID=UPI003D7B6950